MEDSVGDPWIKCSSKTRPGRFYVFNKFTGETKWLKRDGVTRVEEHNVSADEDVPVLAKPSTRTPAQDRLKRLQNHLRKEVKDKEQQCREPKQCQTQAETKVAAAEPLPKPKPTVCNKTSAASVPSSGSSKRKDEMFELAWSMPEGTPKYSLRSTTKNTVRRSSTKAVASAKQDKSTSPKQNRSLLAASSSRTPTKRYCSVLKKSSSTSPQARKAASSAKTTPKSAGRVVKRCQSQEIAASKLSLPSFLNRRDIATSTVSLRSLSALDDASRCNQEQQQIFTPLKKLPRETIKRCAKHENFSPSPLCVKRMRAEQNQQNDEEQPASKEAPNNSMSLGFVSKLKEFYKTAAKALERPVRVLLPTQHTAEAEQKAEAGENEKLAVSQRLNYLYKGPDIEQQQNIAKDSSLIGKHTANTPKYINIPSYNRGSANARLQNFRDLLQQQPSTSMAALQTAHSPSISLDSSLDKAICENPKDNISISSSIGAETEPMDWEPCLNESEYTSSDSSLSTVNVTKSPAAIEAANVLNAESTAGDYYDNVNENLLRFEADKLRLPALRERQWLPNFYYFVLDTNILLKNLTFIDDLSKMKLCDTNGTILFVPYAVLQELDKLKMRDTSISAKVLAVRAIKYLNKNFEAKNRHIQAQNAIEERKHVIAVQCPDDSIINCCLQVKHHIAHMVFLSEDVNLRNKAHCNNIMVSTKSDLVSRRFTNRDDID